MELHTAFLGLGSNIGDRHGMLVRTVYRINNFAPVSAISPVYESAALLPKNAPNEWNTPFLNSVIRIRTDLTPDALLTACQDIEIELGRSPDHEHWSPRPIDIDILFYEDHINNSERLTLPHPGISTRPFVIFPLADIEPGLLINNEETALSLARLLDRDFPQTISRSDIHKTTLIIGEC